MEAEIVRLRDARDYWAWPFIMQGMEQQHGTPAMLVRLRITSSGKPASSQSQRAGIQEEERLNAEINKQKTLLVFKDEESHMNALLQRQMTTFQLQAEATHAWRTHGLETMRNYGHASLGVVPEASMPFQTHYCSPKPFTHMHVGKVVAGL